MRSSLWTKLAATACTAAAMLLTPTMAMAQTALPLTGETLVTYPGPFGGGDVVRDVNGSCNGPLNTSSFTYRAEGVATGPYTGTFEETGSFTIGPMDVEIVPGQFRGDVTQWQASYKITSTTGTVEGTKTLTSSGGGVCASLPSGDFLGQVIASFTYEATITLPDGTKHRDAGTSYVGMDFCHSFGCGSSSLDSFKETYVSTGIEPLQPTPVALVVTPATATNPLGTQHCVTATATDASGNPVSGVSVRFAVAGSVTTSGSGTTNAAGQATFCYTGPELPGGDTITAYADIDKDSTQDVGEPAGAATKVWALPVSTPLCQVSITNGGRITANDGDKATFGGNAQVSKSGQPKGSQTYQDHGPAKPMTVKSTTVLAVVCSPDQKQATIYGKATINGSGSYLFKIDVRDIAEPGVGKDTYRILLSNGYDSGEHPLEGGNIQIRIG